MNKSTAKKPGRVRDALGPVVVQSSSGIMMVIAGCGSSMSSAAGSGEVAD
jgi:hypothetical protein